MTLLQPYSQVSFKKQTGRTVGTKAQPWLLMFLISIFLLGGISTRLAYLQLVRGESNRVLADQNRIRIAPKPPVRGNIFDRKGRILATTRLSHAAFVWPLAQTKPNWEQTVQLIAKILQIPAQEIRQPVTAAGVNSPNLIRIARNLTPEQITAIEEYRSQLEGVEVYIEPIRDYPNGKVGSHILGYTGELNEEQLAKRKADGYRLGDIAGKLGIESALEKDLRGEWGGQQVEVDGSGKIIRILGEKQPKAGKDITLSLDLELQKSAEAILGRRKGAIVALDPRNGEVLAMASYPSFDPNIFSKRIPPEVWREMTSQGDPFINRGIRGFPPASTFKVVTATAGMESGKYPANTVLGTFAYLSAGGVRFYDWNKAGFGPLGYAGALAWSSNTFFGQIGRGVGGPTLIDWSRRYGFGRTTGIELPEETSGLIADAEWKKKNYNWDWTVGDTINMSIGQGFVLATPLQVAVMFAAPANGGYHVKAHLVKQKGDTAEKWRESLNMHDDTIRTIRQGLRQVVTSGTGKKVNVGGIPPVAGKSGTAEAPPRKSHAWFGGFAPYDNPEIVVVAFVEHSGGGGGSVAGPIVGQVMQAYFHQKKEK